jgi:hypothetical protein
MIRQTVDTVAATLRKSNSGNGFSASCRCGLAVATVITLLLVPVFCSISVLDLNIVKWEPGKH